MDEINVGVLLFIPYRAMESAVMVALAEDGLDDLTLAQARLIQRLAPAGSRLTDLAEQAQVTKQTAGVLVDQLERNDYVRRTPDPTDGRARLVRLTERGERACALAARTVTRIEAEWTTYLGARRMAELRNTLTQLRARTDPYQ